jgi:hypothetical protein
VSAPESTQPLRVMFCLGVGQEFFSAGPEERARIFEAIPRAFEDLGGRFGIEVIGTMDDDQLMVGPSETWPWTAYVLADCPDLASVAAVCNILREHDVGEMKLWRYLRIEARVGRPLFFATA